MDQSSKTNCVNACIIKAFAKLFRYPHWHTAPSHPSPSNRPQQNRMLVASTVYPSGSRGSITFDV